MEVPLMRFPRDTSEFTRTLRARVDAYFAESGLKPSGDARVWPKTGVMLALYFVPWALIAFGVTGAGWGFWAAEVAMGLGLAGVGLNVLHDANHGSLTASKKMNDAISMVVDFIGGNSVMWRIQHNVLHHTFTNVDGLDEDIAVPYVMRFSPTRPHHFFHRFQWLYAWGFYAIMTLYWLTIKDFVSLMRYKKSGMLARSGSTFGRVLGWLLVTKVVQFGYVLGLPMVFSGLSVGQILLGWVVMHAVSGLCLAAIFQPAHVLEDHAFAEAEQGGLLPADAFTHQLQTTANFGTRSRLLTWLCGGLNHQIEHHLFPNVCHVHFRKLAPIVRKTAEEFGLPYRSNTSFAEALWLHTRMLWQLGRAA
jgi:linoleoyl-CoA desaturase